MKNNNPTIFAILDYSNRIHKRQAEIWIVNLNFSFMEIPYKGFFFSFNLLTSFLLAVLLSLLEWNKSLQPHFLCFKKKKPNKAKVLQKRRETKEKSKLSCFFWVIQTNILGTFFEIFCMVSMDHSKDNFKKNYLIFKPNYFIFFLIIFFHINFLNK